MHSPTMLISTSVYVNISPYVTITSPPPLLRGEGGGKKRPPRVGGAVPSAVFRACAKKPNMPLDAALFGLRSAPSLSGGWDYLIRFCRKCQISAPLFLCPGRRTPAFRRLDLFPKSYIIRTIGRIRRSLSCRQRNFRQDLAHCRPN